MGAEKVMVSTSKTNGSWVQGTLLTGYCDVQHPHQSLKHTESVTSLEQLEGRGNQPCHSGTHQKPQGMCQLDPHEAERHHEKTQVRKGLT